MTDPEIVRWLAEKMMGWDLPERWRPLGPSVSGETIYDAAGRVWDPLIDARATEQIMEALQAQGFRYWIQARQSVAVEIARFGGKMTWKTAEDWKRAFCLAAVEATGGEV